ncbi:MAG: helix-turn-helix transcriptional regulator [candidate division NC10 bacterium]|nr:helix-turn-helix transcriptional regulator [candidate division NC10 bacterium]MDE2321547.1 helix-turn-helix transcriptional regulator [candidate division NC10 bacterium]
MNYGRAIKICRAAAGLTQIELAKKARIAASHLSLIEAGKRSPRLPTIEKLSRAVGVPNYLVILLASDPQDLRNTPSQDFQELSSSLLELLLQSRKPKRQR